jgi:outer membrane protein assembly factor BamB
MAFRVSAEAQQPSLIPVWISRDMHVPDPPVVANGVVYAIQTGENTVQNPGRPGGDVTGGGAGQGSRGGGPLVPSGERVEQASAAAGALKAAGFRATPVSNLVLYAFDAQTGKQLYSSEKIISTWVHYSEPVVAMGKVFVVSWDAHVYAFGLKP